MQFKHLDINSGLTNNQVKTIYEDSNGFIWVGTVNGLNRFDGYSVKVFRKSNNDEFSLPDNNINEIYEDQHGRIWLNTGSGLAIFDPTTEKFISGSQINQIYKSLPLSNIENIFCDNDKQLWIIHRNTGAYCYGANPDSVKHLRIGHELMPHPISDAQIDSEGNIWVLNRNMAIEVIDPVNCIVIKQYKNELAIIPPSAHDYRFSLDTNNHPWIYNVNDEEGAYYFDIENKKIVHYHSSSKSHPISNDIVSCISTNLAGNVLIGTDHGGLNLIDKKNNTNTVYQFEQGEKNALSQNSITSILRDSNGTLWIGTYKKGVNYFHPDLFKFDTYTHNPTRQKWLTTSDVNTFAEDKNGNLWIGSNGGGLLYFDRKNRTFKTYKHQPNNPSSISSDVIVDLCIDPTGGLWIGTYTGGLNYFDGKKFTRYQHQANNPRSIPNNNVWAVHIDRDKQLWIGTLGGGISSFDPNTNQFSHFTPFGNTGGNSNFVMAIAEDPNSNLWIAKAVGVDFYDKNSGSFTQFVHDENSDNSLSNNTALDIYCDSRGWVWIATREGLNLYWPNEQKFTLFDVSDGLIDNNILTILEDNSGNIWVATPQGLSYIGISIDKNGQALFSFKSYDDKDGLHGKEFNEHAAYKTQKGELIFGGADGFSIFDPANLATTPFAAKVFFNSLKVDNKTVEPHKPFNNRIMLKNTINYSKQLELKHFEKTFSISFLAINFLNPEKTLFHYKLDGFNEQWSTLTGNNREITYTNLHPGTYTLHLYASDSENLQKSEPISLQIIVLPPFWRTKWAYSLYLILILSVIFLIIQQIVKRERNKFLAEQEKRENAKIHEMDMLKLKFFTNISHEFRTPLTLILSPLEKIIKTTDNPNNKNQLKLVQRNAKRLLSLVNQLLDFRKLEVQGLSLDVREGELVSFCRETTESFSDLSESRNIKLSFSSNIESLNASFDYDKIEKIIFNLLSNAFKFTPENGLVNVNFQYLADNTQPKVVIEVSDTGIGIPKDKQELIFERFVQNIPTGTSVNKGSGIGLSLTREFVQMHEGQIAVESVPGLGSSFKVELPLKSSFKLQQANNDAVNFQFGKPKTEDQSNSIEKNLSKPYKLLIVEDNPDIRFYLKDNLKTDYDIIEAANGEQAWQLIPDILPDLIVSDIMMPGVDGIELCRTIKTDKRTSHIPVILLTARTADQHKLEGLENGADDYITKPFNFELLELRIRNLLELREKMRTRFQKNFEIQPSEISITSLDEKFLTKVKTITEENMQEPEFSVEKLSSEVGISRAHLYNKLLALTGKTPIEYIRIMRIRRAAQLLEKSQLTVMEVAYKVGFNDPRYFTKHFKSEYQLTPTQYIKKHATNSSNQNGAINDDSTVK